MDWNKAIEYGQLVNAAYDVFEGKVAVTPGYEVRANVFANDLATDMSRQRGTAAALVSIGLIAQGEGSRDVVMAFRGTMGIKEWVQDAKCEKRAFRQVPGAGETEDGFTDMYDSLVMGRGPEAISILKWLERNVPSGSGSLTICGHSLGGALAQLCAIDVAANGPAAFRKPTVYTYASPRTGDEKFAAKYNQLVPATNRLVNNVDIVPKLPGDPPYKHAGTETVMDSLTLLPPRIRLQPNPLCWHLMPSYLHLMSMAAGGPKIPPDAECAAGEILHELFAQLREDLRNIDKLADEFTAHPRTKLGGH